MEETAAAYPNIVPILSGAHRVHRHPLWPGGGLPPGGGGDLRPPGSGIHPEAEPIGPKQLLDVLVIAPCTGNTLAKLAAGIADTAVTMAAKAHLRNGRPVVVAVSTNDGLGGAARNIGELLSRKHYYFVPFRQDDPVGKPTSLVAEMGLVTATVAAALRGEQIQPLLLGPAGE